MGFFTTMDSTWLYGIILPPKKTFVCGVMLIISRNYSADKCFFFTFPWRKTTWMYNMRMIVLWSLQWHPVYSPDCHFQKGSKRASVSLWTKAIKICAVLSLPQYVIKARLIFFQLVTFLSQMKVFMQVILPLKLVPLKSIHSQEYKWNITLNRITNLEKIRVHIKI